jgi:hypothetical protein
MYPDEKNKKTPSKAVAHIVELHKGLSQLAQEFPWIVGFLEEILKGGLSRNKSVSTKLNCLSEKEARRIGKNLPQALRGERRPALGFSSGRSRTRAWWSCSRSTRGWKRWS